MHTLLRIDSSLFGAQSGSARLTEAYARNWQQAHPAGRVLHRDLSAAPLPHLTAESFQAFSADPDARDPSQQAAVAVSDALIAELRRADELVIGAPMYNFTIPSLLKAWIDHVARAGVSFRYTERGPEGLLDIARATVISTRGGRYAGTPQDTQTPYLRQVLGFLGVGDIDFIYAESMAGDDAELVAAEQQILAQAA